MTNNPANTLREYRPLLLAMEAIGWFHLAGKAKVEFLRKQAGERGSYNEKTWYQQESPPFPWDGLLHWAKVSFKNLPGNAWPGSFAEFTSKHADKSPGLLGLLQAAHGIVSGVEKNIPASTSGYLKQGPVHMWLSSPWGHPKRNLLEDPPWILSPQGWQTLVGEMRWLLEKAGQLATSPPPGGDSEVQKAWGGWRERAIGPDSFIRRAMLSTLAETRVPNNDVTLWDQSYVTAALFKSAVAGALLDSNFNWGENNLKSITCWRLLTVGIPTRHYEARSVKIGDWTGAQRVIAKFFKHVAQLVEVDLAVGSLLYQDEMVAVFSFPGEQSRQSSSQNLGLKDLKGFLEDTLESYATCLCLETPPLVLLSDPTRSLVPIVKELQRARRILATPLHRTWSIPQKPSKGATGHICPVCGVRLNGNGKPISRTLPCEVCLHRRHTRRDEWLQAPAGGESIWFEEVADRNGRIGLLSLSLDVLPWLSGERIDSLRAQSIPEWAKNNLTLGKGKNTIPNPVDPSDPQAARQLASEIKSKLQKDNTGQRAFPSKDSLMQSLHGGFSKFKNTTGCSSDEKCWEEFFKLIVEDRADAPKWSKLNDHERGEWLSHQFFRKLPSPGRIYRFWREAEEFFRELHGQFRLIASRSPEPWRTRRVVLIPAQTNNWENLQLYEGMCQGQRIGLLWSKNLGGFVSVSNLSRVLGGKEPEKVLVNTRIVLRKEDTGETQEVEIKKVKSPDPLHIYTPLITLGLSPTCFRVLLPLEAVSECVDLTIRWWKERFARVWDRLPLRIGVVAFPRAVPYQAVVEAVRNVEDALEGEKSCWQVEKKERWEGVVALHLTQSGKSLLQLVPVSLPDGREDVFYPYMEVDDNTLRLPRDFCRPNGPILRHVADLRVGEGVRVFPSGIITLFMRSTAARFSVGLPRWPQEWEGMRSTWRLVKELAPSQRSLQRLRSELERMEAEWRSPQGAWEAGEQLRQATYRAILVEALENPPLKALEYLTQAAMDGRLAWALEWHLGVLKEGERQ